MKRKFKMWAAVIGFSCLAFCGQKVEAKEQSVIPNGVFIDEIDLSGMTADAAKETVDKYVSTIEEVPITLVVDEDNQVEYTAGDLGVYWSNPEVLDEALYIGKKGNLINRYKELKDLEKEDKVYQIAFAVDEEKVASILAEEGLLVDKEAVNSYITKENGELSVVLGTAGMKLDQVASVKQIADYISAEWNHEEAAIDLVVEVIEPKGTKEELEKVTDVLGTYTTSFSTSSTARSANVVNACNKVSGQTVYPGEEFSTKTLMVPFTPANGYYEASSYSAGRVVESVGGGICQVSSTLYNAVLFAELEVTTRYNHAMVVPYVKLSADATISDESGLDFTFVNNTDYPIYIEGFTTKDKKITMSVYGVETRPDNREIYFESEILSTTAPVGEAIYTDASKPVGYIQVNAAHTGYVAKLWKIVKEDGVEVSRTEVSKSTYKMAPKMATVGIATTDPNVLNAVNAAIATGSIDYTQAIINQLVTPAAAQPVVTTPVDESVTAPVAPAAPVTDPAQAAPAQ